MITASRIYLDFKINLISTFMNCCSHFQWILKSTYWWRSWRKEIVKSVCAIRILNTPFPVRGDCDLERRTESNEVSWQPHCKCGFWQEKKINTGHRRRPSPESWGLIHLCSHWLTCHSSSFKGGKPLLSKHAEVFIGEMIVCLASCGKCNNTIWVWFAWIVNIYNHR